MNDEELNDKRRKLLLRHISNVREKCDILGEKLIEQGEESLGHRLMANGRTHDNSKFYGIEWKYLHSDVADDNPRLFKEAMNHHTSINKHHPEYWWAIQNMPRLYVAEMVCDWVGRSNEFGNDLRGWIKDKATKKFKMTVQSSIYKEIKEFVDLLLDPKFD